MTNSQRLTTVRAFLRQWIAEATLASKADAGDSESIPLVADESIATESIVIREGFYCGRSFETANHRAVWFIEEDELKIHNQDGEVVAVFQGDAITLPVVEAIVETREVIRLESNEQDDSDEDSIRRAA